MNPYLIWILCFLLGVYLLDSLADLLNLTRLGDDLPKEFAGIYDREKYKKSLRYQKENVQFELIRSTFFLIVTVIFILTGGFNWIDQFARSQGWGTLSTGLLFVGILSLLRFLLGLPFSIYGTFVLEEKYGFNKTTPSTFFLDILKGGVLGVLLGGLAFSGIVYFFEKTGPNAWLYGWASLTCLQIILMYLAPSVIMPLFNKFSPLPDTTLRKAIEDYAKTRNFQLSGIYTMDSSKRSTKANAFFTGFGKNRRLVLFDTLIAQHTTEELVAVLAHEIGHFELKHILKSMAISILTTGIIFYAFALFMQNSSLFEAFKMENISVYASIVFVGFLYAPLLRVLSVLTLWISRKHEYEADTFARNTYGHPELLISALKKMSVEHLSHLTPHPLKVALDYSHPPILERIRALRAEKK